MSNASPLLDSDAVRVRRATHAIGSVGGQFGTYGTLSAIVLLALLVRLIGLDAWGLWTDEALTVVLSKWSLLEMLRFPLDPTPPLYYALHGALIGGDASAAGTRAISVAAGVVAVAAMYGLGRLAFGRTGGLVAAALLAVWTSHVEYSQEARAYGLLFLLSLAASIGVALFAKALREEDRIRAGAASGRRLGLAVFAVASVLSFYTHVVAALWIALTGTIVVAFALAHRRRVAIIEVAVALVTMAVLALPGLRWLYLSSVHNQDFNWLKQADLARFIGENANAFLPSGLWDNAFAGRVGGRLAVKAAVIAAWCAVLAAGLVLWGRQLLAQLRARPELAALMVAYLALPLLVWALGWIARPIFMERTILFAAPGVILLTTGLCVAAGGTRILPVGAALVAVYAASTLLNSAEKQDWRGAVAFLTRSAAPGDMIAVCPVWNFPAVRHAAASAAPAEVVGIARGGLVRLEPMLGTDPAWDATYHQTVARRTFDARFGAGEAARPRTAPDSFRIEPGRSVWRLDGHCYGSADRGLDAALAGVDAEPRTVWLEGGEDRPNRIRIRRYLATAPVSLQIERRQAPQ